jgi:hypothetical protein
MKPLFFPFPKDPEDVSDYYVDFSGSLKFDSIIGIPDIEITPADMTASLISTQGGQHGANTGIGCRLTGGTPGMTYQIKYSFDTKSGMTLSYSVFLQCISK